MPFIVIAFVVFVLIAIGVRRLRRRRHQWLRSLGLNGRWLVQPLPKASHAGADNTTILEFVGTLDQGQYRWLPAAGASHRESSLEATTEMTTGATTESTEQGTWFIRGATLALHPKVMTVPKEFAPSSAAGEVREYELRLLQPRVLGLVANYDGARLELRKEHSNVVPLPAKGRRR